MEDLSALVIRARDGDHDAFAIIVRRFQDMAVGYGRSLLGNFHLAEDAAQEAFLEAYLCLRQLNEPAAFPGWFRRIVFKQCDRLTRGRRQRFEPLLAVEEVRSLQPNQAESMEEREMKDQVLEAIESLPEHERAAVVLFYLSGYSQQEIASFLDVNVATVKKRLFYARKRLREMLMDVVADSLRERRPSRNDAFAAAVMDMLTAARTGDTERVKELLQRNRALLRARDWLGNSALIMAMNSGQQAVAELLFHAGVLPDIHEAAAIGDTTRLDALLRENGSRINAVSAEGFAPLALAAHFGQAKATRMLIERGANINAISIHPLQVTPLHAALFGRQVETARMLIDIGADVNIRRGGKNWPRCGWTALHYAAAYGMIGLIELLLARGADDQATDQDGRTPLRVATDENQAAAVEMLSGK